LVSIVSLTVAIGTVPLSFLADRFQRAKSIFAMAIVWSLATIACAFAESYSLLLAARSVVGLGEAAYGAVGAALLATLFPARMRSTILAAFLGASLLGSMLGVALGGVIAERWGWRAGFGVVGIPGLLLAVLFIVAARDYKTAALPSDARIQSALWMRTRTIIVTLLGRRNVMLASIGGGLQLVMASCHRSRARTELNRPCCGTVIGLAAGPFVAGLLSDAYGLSFALSVIPISCLLAAVLFAAAGRTYEAELRADEDVETPFGDTVSAHVA
jgi:predicted MFS family arabinose efflux permease